MSLRHHWQPFVEVVQRIYLAEKKKNLPDLVFLGSNSGKVGVALVLPDSIVRVEVYCGRESLENGIKSKGISSRLHTTAVCLKTSV